MKTANLLSAALFGIALAMAIQIVAFPVTSSHSAMYAGCAAAEAAAFGDLDLLAEPGKAEEAEPQASRR